MVDTKSVLKKVKKLEIKTKNLVDGLLTGAYHSVFKGRGIEFSEVREYVVGDDVRAIDWNVTARMDMPFVKEFIEERDLTVYILYDISASGNFGNVVEKKEVAVEMIVSLMFAALRNSDNVGLVLHTDEVERFIPPVKGKRHVLRLVRELVCYEPKKKGTSINKALDFLLKVIKRRSVVFIVSDFMTDEKFDTKLRILKNRHDVVAINIYDSVEHNVPDVGYIELEDEETGEQILVNTSDVEFRTEYARLVKETLNDLKRTFDRLNIGYIPIDIEKGFEMPLRKFFKLKQRRVR